MACLAFGGLCTLQHIDDKHPDIRCSVESHETMNRRPKQVSDGWRQILHSTNEIPSVDDVKHIVEHCRQERNPKLATNVYMTICSYGLDLNEFLGNHIVPMLVVCNYSSQATQAFLKLVQANSYSWTSLIQGYVCIAEYEQAFYIFEKMHEHGIASNSVTFLSLIKACARMNHIQKGYEMHNLIVQSGFEGDCFLISTLIDMYFSCMSFREAEAVFHNQAAIDVVSWNTLIFGYVDVKFFDEALDCFERMQRDNIYPDIFSYIYALKACGAIGALEKGQDLHAMLVEDGFESDSSVGNTLIDFYGKFRWLAEARSVLDELPNCDVISWTALIGGYSEFGLEEDAFNCFEEMQKNNIVPNAVTYSYVLKACKSMGALNLMQSVHMKIVKEGGETKTNTGNVLVDVYANLGLFVEAENVFCSLSVQDVVSWTTLIGGYVYHGLFKNAWNCFEQMRKESISPNEVTFICLLKAIGSLGDITSGHQLHHEIILKALESDISIGNAMVDMYAKFTLFMEASLVFDRIPVRTTSAWNSLITASIASGLEENALDCLTQMNLEGVSRDTFTLCNSLKCCSNIGAIDNGHTIHSDIVKMGLEQDLSIGNTIVALYGKCGFLVDTQKVFNKLLKRDVVSWTAIIQAYHEHGYGDEALQCLEQMQDEDTSPNLITFDCILKACKNLGVIEKVQRVHIDLVKIGLDLDTVLGSSLVEVYAGFGFLSEGRKLFDELPHKEIGSWNALIIGYSGEGYFDEAKKLFHNLPEKDLVSWTALISGYVDGGLCDEALNMFEEMQSDCIYPDAITFACCLKACASMGNVQKTHEMHLEIIKEGYEQDLFLRNSLLDAYAKCGLLEEAQNVFDSIPVRDVVSWTALVAGYVSQGSITRDQVLEYAVKMQSDNAMPNLVFWNSMIMSFTENEQTEVALELMPLIQEQGIMPDDCTMLSAIKACGKAASLVHGKRIHAQLSVESQICVNQENALIDMYGKCGEMIDARLMFDQMPLKKDVVRWNVLIAGYARVGQSTQVFDLYERMKMEGLDANETTLLSILTVCSHVGLLYEAMYYLEEMCHRHEIFPSIKHFNCLVHLLGRAGQLNDAIEMLKMMLFQPNDVTWRILLGSSRICHDIDIGIQAYDSAMALDENYSVPFVMLSNIYAEIEV